MGSQAIAIPPPPDGFTLDAAPPPPPAGFTLDSAQPSGKTGLATKLNRPAVANNASPQDQAFVSQALGDQGIPHPIATGLWNGAKEAAEPFAAAILGGMSPSELMETKPGQILTKLLSHPKVVQAAKDAMSEWADTIPGVKATRKTVDLAKTAYGVAKDVLTPEAEAAPAEAANTVPEAQGIDTSALPVKTPTEDQAAKVIPFSKPEADPEVFAAKNRAPRVQKFADYLQSNKVPISDLTQLSTDDPFWGQLGKAVGIKAPSRQTIMDTISELLKRQAIQSGGPLANNPKAMAAAQALRDAMTQ